MTVRFLDSIFSLTGLRSVFTILVHSLWLGAVMALLAGIIIILTNRSGSLLRYRLLTGLLMLFAFSMTYIFYDATTSNIKPGADGKVTIISGEAEIQQTQNKQQQYTAFNSVLSFVEKHADTIVLMWFAVICFKCIRLISGLQTLHRLKKTNILEAGIYWSGRMNELAIRIGIVKQVALLQSSLAKVPMVIGHLKPIILFPIGMLNALPADEVEAILLHELAHIRRNDFLINLLQQFAEIFFFFNPGVLWVSSLIKNERENCCDDIAIAVTHDKKKFIHALVAFQEYNTGVTYATQFPGAKNHLLNRVKRIITNNNKTLNNMEKLILASGIIITTLAALAFSPGSNPIKKEAMKTVPTTAIAVSVDKATTRETKYNNNTSTATAQYSYDKNIQRRKISGDTSKIHYSGVVDGRKIQLTEENGQVKELYVDGKEIPADQYHQYNAIIEKVHDDMRENTAKLKMQSDLLSQEKEEMQLQQTQEMKEAEAMKEQKDLMKENFYREQEELTKQKQEAQKKIDLTGTKNEEMMKAEMLKMQADLLKQQKELKVKEIEFQKQAEKMKLQQDKFDKMMKDSVKVKRVTRVQATTYATPEISVSSRSSATSEAAAKAVVSARSVASVNPVIEVDPVMSVITISSVDIKPVVAATLASNSTSNEIIHDLEKANIINTTNNLSFRLTNDELIVNGVKQTDEVHQNILKNYVKKPGTVISVSYSNKP